MINLMPKMTTLFSWSLRTIVAATPRLVHHQLILIRVGQCPVAPQPWSQQPRFTSTIFWGTLTSWRQPTHRWSIYYNDVSAHVFLINNMDRPNRGEPCIKLKHEKQHLKSHYSSVADWLTSWHPNINSSQRSVKNYSWNRQQQIGP